MTHANSFDVSTAPSRIQHGAYQRKLLIAGLLAGLLLTIACSKEKNKPAGSAVPTPSVSTAPTQSTTQPESTPVLSAAKPATQKPVPKKSVRKHSSLVTYKDDSNGVSFGYPRKYSLKTGEDLKSDSDAAAMNFVQPGGLSSVSVEMPGNAYPGTDLTSAVFQVNLHKGLTETECAQFATPASKPDDKNAVQPSEVKIGELDFGQVENITGEASKQVDTKYYHVFENGTCYEFALGLTTAWDGNEDSVNLVDREDVFRRLEKILAGVKITPVAVPASPVASDPTAATTTQPEIAK